MSAAWQLVGRTSELDRIHTALADAACRGVVLAGPPGVGKTRLTVEALSAQQASGRTTELARATRSTASVPFGALAHLLQPAHDVDPVSPANRLAVLQRLTSVVAERATSAPLVLAVDDAHLLDEGAATVVHQLAATTDVRVLVTVRTGEAAPDAVTALWKDGLCQRLEVSRWSQLTCASSCTGCSVVLSSPRRSDVCGRSRSGTRSSSASW